MFDGLLFIYQDSRQSGIDNKAYENPSYANGSKKKDGEYVNEYF